ncbi:MAG: hypothetical protein OEM03_07270 [Chromatiales bacterium]|nr:hypothetical protein [Chromatiales bacterium]
MTFSRFSRFATGLGLATMLLIASAPALSRNTIDTAVLSAVEWRMIGPYRGGRVTTVTGVADKPWLYYMGATGGGVWKTENAGATWENISDEFFNVGTIGAVAVSESDNNVLYVGTGEAPIRGVTTSHGDGVYKSTDAGKTWQHIGLSDAGQISRIKIHPQNPDLVYVAVQGQIWGPSDERGVYRSNDGGKTWEQVLKTGSSTGASDLVMNPANPRILYAAMWNHYRKPWYVHSGGTDAGIFKSTDGGDNWTKLTGGLPEMVGKIGIDVPAANPDRLYAIVEAHPGEGGLWRSDDAGESWELVNETRVIQSRAWYYNHITADPNDENTVWIQNVPLLKSIDGGKSFERVDTAHGDYHDHWINPNDSSIMINGSDGGASVTLDGGKTWSTLMNQPTAQFYRVTTDNLTPFRIYGGQQDNSTVAIASATWDNGIGREDYFPVGGGESAHIVFDENDPRLIYATTINGTLTEYDVENRRLREIKPYPQYVYGLDPKDLKYRANWNTPVAISPHDPKVIYYGAQKLLKTSDRGVTWTEISPDLTRNDITRLGTNGGPITNESVGAEFYHTIFYIVESPHEAGTIWVGADDGLLHLTRDGGGNWEDVSPKHKGEAMINAIELSPHDPATAYLAVTGYKLNDFHPYIYKSDNYGKSWKRIDKGLPKNTFVRVVREDPARKGVLYAGTEGGMFVSFNDGGDWQSLDLNLPPVPITDLSVRQGKLVAATQGRGFWILDDLSLLRQASPEIADKPLHVFAPADALLVSSGGRQGEFEAANPPSGATLYYYIKDEVEGPLAIDILDAAGTVVRSYSSEESDFERCRLRNADARKIPEFEYPTVEQGLNKWNWDLRQENMPCLDKVPLYAGGFSGPRVVPGTYTVKVTLGDTSQQASFAVHADPRVQASDEEIATLEARVEEVNSLLRHVLGTLEAARKSRSQIQTLMADYPDAELLHKAGSRAITAIDGWEDQITQRNHGTLEDEDGWPTMLDGQIHHVLDVMDGSGPPVSAGALERLADLKASWSTLEAELQRVTREDIEPINQWARQSGIKYVSTPTR